MKNVNKNIDIKWLKLSLYKNCFGEGEGTHLGLKFYGEYLCLTHSKGNGVECPKKYLRMAKISSRKEYFKRCTVQPEIVNKTQMFIAEEFVIQALLHHELNK